METPDQACISRVKPPYLYEKSFYVCDGETRMDETNKNFLLGAVIGAVIIIIIDLLISFLGPFIGGFVAGYIAKGDIVNAGKSGLVAGILAAIVISIVVYAGIISHAVAGYVPAVGTGFLLYIAITLYLAIFAFLGGAISGAFRK